MALKNKSGISSLQDQYKKNMSNIPEPPKNDTHAAVETKLTPPEPQQNKRRGKKWQKYLRLDITDYQEYISLMAGHQTNAGGKYVSMTQYILRSDADYIRELENQNMQLQKTVQKLHGEHSAAQPGTAEYQKLMNEISLLKSENEKLKNKTKHNARRAGRKPSKDRMNAIAKAEVLLKCGYSDQDIISELGISRATFYRYKKSIKN